MAATCGFSSGFSSGFEVCEAEAEPTDVARGIPLPPRQKLRRLAKIRIGGAALQFTITTGAIRIQRRVAGAIIQPIETTGRLSSYQRLGSAVLQETLVAGLARIELGISGDAEALPALVEGRVGVYPAPVEDRVRIPQRIAIAGLPVLGGVVTVGVIRRSLAVAGIGRGRVSIAAGAIGHAHAVAGVGRGIASVAAGVVRCAFAVVGEAFAQASEATGSLAVACAIAGVVTSQPSMAIGSIETDDEEASLMVLGLPSEVLI